MIFVEKTDQVFATSEAQIKHPFDVLIMRLCNEMRKCDHENFKVFLKRLNNRNYEKNLNPFKLTQLPVVIHVSIYSFE